MIVTKSIIKDKFMELGLKEGDNVLVHSSLKSLGYVKDGIETVINAMIETIGKEGTLMVPTFTPTLAFDLNNTPSQMGVISEKVRQMNGALRSNQPSHSFAAIGRNAKFLVRDHEKTTALGKDSPIAKLLSLDGYVLLIGVGHDKNSLIHLAEILAIVPYMINSSYRQMVVRDGKKKKVKLEELPKCSTSFTNIDPYMEGHVKKTKINESTLTLFKAKDCVDVCRNLLGKDPEFLLCKGNICTACLYSKGKIKGNLMPFYIRSFKNRAKKMLGKKI